jgi:hypothetical protein
LLDYTAGETRRGADMKILIFVLMLGAAIAGMAQDKSVITVKNSTVTGDVVIVTIQAAGEAHDLQCSKSVLFCKAPSPGKYVMLRLPKNRGIYDCPNVVDLYRESDDTEQDNNKLGEYCMLEK